MLGYWRSGSIQSPGGISSSQTLRHSRVSCVPVCRKCTASITCSVLYTVWNMDNSTFNWSSQFFSNWVFLENTFQILWRSTNVSQFFGQPVTVEVRTTDWSWIHGISSRLFLFLQLNLIYLWNNVLQALTCVFSRKALDEHQPGFHENLTNDTLFPFLENCL